MEVIPRYLKKRYLSQKAPGAFQGASSFIKNNKYKDPKKVLKVLQELKTYTLHKPVRLRHTRRPIICNHIDLLWGTDLIVLENIARKNRGYAYILLTVDCFSKMVYVEKLKSKNSTDVLAAFKAIFEKRKPEKLYADKERAFISKKLQDFFEKQNISMYHTVSWLHSSLAERYIGRFKRIMARMFTHNGNEKWIGLEQDIADQINNSYNRSIGMKPIQVNSSNESIVWDNLYRKFINAKVPKARYSVGDLVRISTRTLKDVFRKSYNISWTLEVFKIKEIKGQSLVPYYTLVDLQGNNIPGSYYNEDLQLVTREETSDN